MKALRSVKISLANIRYFYRRAGIHRRSSLATALGVFERNETRAAWAATIRQLWERTTHTWLCLAEIVGNRSLAVKPCKTA
jgi:hypothetical protein